MADGQRGAAAFDAHDAGQGDLAPGRGADVKAVEAFGVGLQRRVDFLDHAVLVAGAVDDRDLALGEGVVERVGDGADGDAEAGGGLAVDHHIGLRSRPVLVAADVGDARFFAQAVDQAGGPVAQEGQVLAEQDELVGIALAAAAAQFLGGPGEGLDARDFLQLRAEAFDDLFGGHPAFGHRLEADGELAAVHRGPAGGHADGGADAGDGGVAQDHLDDRALALGHGREGDLRPGDRGTLEHPGVLDRHEALGHQGVEPDRQAGGGDGGQQHQPAEAQGDVQRGGVAALQRGQGTVGGAVQRTPEAGGWGGARAHVSAEQHRREGERDQGGDGDGDGQDGGEFVEQPAEDAAHEQDRNEHGDQRNADRDDGEADLGRAIEGGAQRRFARLGVAHDIFDHHDGVVDDEADGDGQRHQREIVDREAEEPHGGQAAGQRQRYGDGGSDGGHQAAHEHQHHQQHQGAGDQQRGLHLAHAGADGLGAVGQDGQFDIRRHPAAQQGQHRFDAVHGFDDVGVAGLADLEQDRRLGAEPGGKAHVRHPVDHVGHVAQADHATAGDGLQHQRAVFGGHGELAVQLDQRGLVLALEAAGGAVDVAAADGVVDVLAGQAGGGQGGGVQANAHRGFLGAVDLDLRDAVELREALGQDAVREVVKLGHRQAAGGQRQAHDRGGGGVEFSKIRAQRQVGRQVGGGGVDRGLDVLGGAVDLSRQIELDDDGG